MTTPLLTPFVLLFPVLLVFAASHDLMTRLIPNPLVVALVAAFPFAALAVGLPLLTVALHILCCVTVVGLGFGLFAGGYIGGGDAKLFGATALWLGWDMLPALILTTAISGGLLALAYLAVYALMPKKRDAQAPTLPYGCAIAASGLYLFPQWLLLIL
jgi:prepilin peptidase CpaA